MKVCTICSRTFADDQSVCQHDGNRLIAVVRSAPTAAAPVMDWDGPLAGDVVGQYRLESLVAEGGMGRVFRAVHLTLGRRAAIKFLLPEHAARPDQVQRFFNEARAVNAIHHPHIIDIYDFAQELTAEGAARCYLVMEFLDGEDTRARLIRTGPFSAEALISVATQVARTLAQTHEAGILHRDLKPDNIFLCRADGRDDFVKVLDFGAAKAFGDRQGHNLTRPGVAVGTPEYMSPEQILNRPTDGRVDQYGLGVVCYELLTGARPFTSEKVAEILAAHTRQPPPPMATKIKEGLPAVPAALEAVVIRCMAKDPADRYPDLWAAAEAFENARPAQAAPQVSVDEGLNGLFSDNDETVNEPMAPLAVLNQRRKKRVLFVALLLGLLSAGIVAVALSL